MRRSLFRWGCDARCISYVVQIVAAVPAIGLIAGSALGYLLPDLPFRIAVVLLIAVLVAGVWAWRAASSVGLAIAVGTGFFIGAALLSAAAWRDAWRPPLRIAFEDLARRERRLAAQEGRRLPEDDEAFAVVMGTLGTDAAVTPTGVSLNVTVDAIQSYGARGTNQSFAATTPVSGGVQATVAGAIGPERAGQWRAGRRVRLPIQLHRPARYLDPDVPDGERALARRGTTLVGTVKSGALVELIARGSWVDEATAALRAASRRAIGQAVGPWSLRSAAIVDAIVIGDRAGLDDEVQRRLQEAGTYHVIAISGGNIAILAGLMLSAFRLAGFLGRTAMLAAIAVLVAYDRLVGGGASVDRATLTAVLYFSARVIDQRGPPLNALGFVAVCLVAARPLSVLDPAFVLTFGATLAIVWIAPSVRAWRVPSLVAPAASMLAASAATELMLLPVGALAFARVTFAGLVLNFAAIPLMAIVQVAGMALVPVSLVSTRASGLLGRVAHVAAEGLVRSAELVEYLPALSFRVAPPSWWVVVAYYAAIVALIFWWRRPRLRVAALGAAAGAAIWIVGQPWAFAAGRGDGRLHLTFLDVGQGDAALIRFPRGAAVLVDAGGLTGSRFDLGDRVVAPVLRILGVRRLDAVVLTHGDPDHVGGFPSVIREFRPRQVWEGIVVPRFEPLRALQLGAQAVGSTWLNVKTGDRAFFDEVELVVRHPGLPDWERQRVRNDDSIVIELRWHDVSALLTGDIGRAVERTLSAELSRTPIRIVKVPHHGSGNRISGSASEHGVCYSKDATIAGPRYTA
ncbi:MAG: ComEC/Rec2 family competence protein [Acidobacteriota bacterium]